MGNAPRLLQSCPYRRCGLFGSWVLLPYEPLFHCISEDCLLLPLLLWTVACSRQTNTFGGLQICLPVFLKSFPGNLWAWYLAGIRAILFALHVIKIAFYGFTQIDAYGVNPEWEGGQFFICEKGTPRDDLVFFRSSLYINALSGKAAEISAEKYGNENVLSYMVRSGYGCSVSIHLHNKRENIYAAVGYYGFYL